MRISDWSSDVCSSDLVAAGLPAAVTLACEDESLRARLAERLAGPAFRPYASSAVIGAEIGGAVKNVPAIACGVGEGDRQRGVWGKRLSVRVDLGGRRILHNNTAIQSSYNANHT